LDHSTDGQSNGWSFRSHYDSVMHLSGQLSDALVANQTATGVRQVAGPKLAGLGYLADVVLAQCPVRKM
jgi:hypothetical protein